MRRSAAAVVFALAVATGIATPDATAMPPKGACISVQASGAMVREVPWAQNSLDPDRAWPFSRGAGVTVAVIDSGIDSDHPQLAQPGKVLPGFDFIRGRANADFDCVSHGTAVASIISGDPMPGIGFHGVAPDARLLPVRVSDLEAGAGEGGNAVNPSVFGTAIRYAVDHGARVINLSVVLYADVPVVREAIAYAVRRDVVVVAAVGNQHQRSGADPVPYPAAYPGVLGVGAITIEGVRLDASQVGPYVDLTAPGGGVLAATRANGYVFWDGTSFATPFVSGAAALVRAAFPTLSAVGVEQRLIATADAAPGGASGPEYGHGVLDPYRAVTDVLSGAPASIPPQPRLTTPAPDLAGAQRTAQAHKQAARADHTVAMLGGAVGAAALLLGLVILGRRRNFAPGLRWD
ncbi:MAG: type VII secretion-associated serine protease mycosin [Pseudonocardiales bacterium]|nr:MAG: type VII secretion-associated serine protease mycosin [Pseudonocardiales bacterium]